MDQNIGLDKQLKYSKSTSKRSHSKVHQISSSESEDEPKPKKPIKEKQSVKGLSQNKGKINVVIHKTKERASPKLNEATFAYNCPSSSSKRDHLSNDSDIDSDRTIDSDDLDLFIKSPEPTTTVKFQNKPKPDQNDRIENKSHAHVIKPRSDGANLVHKKSSGSSSQVAESNISNLSRENQKVNDIPKCPYGEKCYRKNPVHFKEYSHPDSTPVPTAVPSASTSSTSQERGQPLSYQENVFGFYMTKVAGIPNHFNHPNHAVGIKDILSSKWGKLRSSAQFNYMIDIPWLMSQYPPVFQNKPVLLVHGEQRAAKDRLERSATPFPNVSFCQAKLEIMYGTHHTKMMLLHYEEGLRVVIHTANLVEGDWHQKSQGVWMSPMFPPLKTGPSVIKGDSETHFKADLIQYLSAYHNSALEPWLDMVKVHDLSSARVFLIGSIPGRHVGINKVLYGHLKLQKVLKSHCTLQPNSKWPLIGQFSSIGTLGPNPNQWLCGEWLRSLSAFQGAPAVAMSQSLLQLIYPSVDNVRTSLEGYPAGTSLPYHHKVASKQPFLVSFLHQWKSQVRGRSRASPHIKTYCRLSPDYTKIAWFLLTSANLSKAAWGALEKQGSQLMIRSYELGALFLPHFWKSGDHFVTSPSNSSTVFPLPYDVPLTKYSKSDEPWIWDIPHVKAPDCNGMKWCPPA